MPPETKPDVISKIAKAHIPLKYLIFYIIILLIILYFCKEQDLFEKLLMILVPFLIGSSVKLSCLCLTGMV